MACLERAGAICAAGGWKLNEADRDDTGVLFASSFAHHEGAMREVAARARREQIARLRTRLAALSGVDEAGARVVEGLLDAEEGDAVGGGTDDVSGGRRAALQFTLDVHAQLAQIVGARGPSTYVSNACASTTSAIQVASNTIRVGEARRMLVVGSDAILSDPHAATIVRSFVQLGAASQQEGADKAVLPFSKRRGGFVIGEGAVALLLECDGRHHETTARMGRTAPSDAPLRTDTSDQKPSIYIASSRIANSAHHGTALDSAHIAATLRRCVDDARGDLRLEEFAARSLYVSHETCTPTCATHEVAALRAVFGDAVTSLRITNTKCYTGHAMGACVEDVAAVAVLGSQHAPRVLLGEVDTDFFDLALCEGKSETEKWEERFDFAIHVALGMGSHVAIVIYRREQPSS
jgi:3-oxoacyl-(acyl-carrier-protein) synthase